MSLGQRRHRRRRARLGDPPAVRVVASRSAASTAARSTSRSPSGTSQPTGSPAKLGGPAGQRLEDREVGGGEVAQRVAALEEGDEAPAAALAPPARRRARSTPGSRARSPPSARAGRWPPRPGPPRSAAGRGRRRGSPARPRARRPARSPRRRCPAGSGTLTIASPGVSTCAGVVRIQPVLVQRDRQHGRVVAEDRLGAVAVMDVPVEDRDARRAAGELRPARRHRGRVEAGRSPSAGPPRRGARAAARARTRCRCRPPPRPRPPPASRRPRAARRCRCPARSTPRGRAGSASAARTAPARRGWRRGRARARRAGRCGPAAGRRGAGCPSPRARGTSPPAAPAARTAAPRATAARSAGCGGRSSARRRRGRCAG